MVCKFMSKTKVSNQEIQELFKEGNLVARALHLPTKRDDVGYDLSEFENEWRFLGAKKSKEGEHSNVERDGQRNRSATLLVPDVDMDLFSDIGLLYNADKSTIRGYMYHDSVTVSGTGHDNFYNINVDKNKLKPIVSKKEFLGKYREYRKETDGTEREHVKYNEVLGNFFPESVTGLVAKENTPENKLKLLAAKHYFSTQNLDLPMVIMDKGKVTTWSPDLAEISELLEYGKAQITQKASKHPEKTKEQLLTEYASSLGYAVSIKDFNTKITPDNISILNKNECTSKDVIDLLHEATGIPKGGKFAYGIEGRLKEVVNQRLESDGLPKVNNLKNTVIHKQDIENLVSILNDEIAIKNPKHKPLSKKEVQELSSSILTAVHDSKHNKRLGEVVDIQSISKKLSKHLPNSKFSKIREFFKKVASLYEEKQISKKVNISKNSSRSL